MEKLCISGVALLFGAAAFWLASVADRSGSTCVILGVLVGAYGLWVGEQLYTKIHHH
jgi:hypothetical protein